MFIFLSSFFISLCIWNRWLNTKRYILILRFIMANGMSNSLNYCICLICKMIIEYYLAKFQMMKCIIISFLLGKNDIYLCRSTFVFSSPSFSSILSLFLSAVLCSPINWTFWCISVFLFVIERENKRNRRTVSSTKPNS